MAVKRAYVVKKGRTTGVFYNWEDCKAAVDGYPGAQYKGFATLQEALAYMKGGGSTRTKEKQRSAMVETAAQKRNNTRRAEGAGRKGSLDEHFTMEQGAAPAILPDAPDKLLAYVDGSYDHSLKKYAFGCVFILPDGSVYTENGNGDNPDSLALRNVTGEMLGAMFAVRFAMVNNFSKIEIRYDYEGIEKWVTKAWRSKTELTQKYAAAMQQWGQVIEISFTKVTAHSSVYYNEMADQLAKAGLVNGHGVPAARRLEEMEPWKGVGEDGTDQAE